VRGNESMFAWKLTKEETAAIQSVKTVDGQFIIIVADDTKLVVSLKWRLFSIELTVYDYRKDDDEALYSLNEKSKNGKAQGK
jgi:predicted transcriptional regulator